MPELLRRVIIRCDRAVLASGLGLLAAALLILSGYDFRWHGGAPLPVTATVLMLAGGAVWGLALLAARATISTFGVSPEKAEQVPLRGVPLGIGILALVVFTEANANLTPLNLSLSIHLQMALFVGGVASVAWGLGGGQPVLALLRAIRDPAARRASLALLLVTLVALGVRVWHLGSAVHIMVDELHFMDAVIRLDEAPRTRLLMPIDTIATFTHLFPYWQWWTVRVLGYDLPGLRLVSAVIGTLTVPALYLLAKTLFDRPTALIAAVLLAAFPPHIHFSRLALNNIADPFFGVLALAFLARGLKGNRQGDYVLAGVLLGLAQYFYEGGRLVFTGLIMVWLALVVVVWRPRGHWHGIGRLVLAFLLTAAPLYIMLTRPSYALAPRFESQAINRHKFQDALTDPSALRLYFVDHIRPAALHLVHTPDSSQFYYGGQSGLILWYLVPAFLLGLFAVLWRGRLPGLLLLIWVGITLLGNSLLVNPDWSVRFVVLFPALVLLMAVGLRTAGSILWPARARDGLLAGLVIVLAVSQVGYYLGPHLTFYNRAFRKDMRDFYDALYRAAPYPPGSVLYYIGDDPVFWPVVNSTLRFWRLDITVIHLAPEEVTPEAIAQMPRDRVLLFFVEPDDLRPLNTLRQYFTLEGPFWSDTDSVPRDRQYVLCVANPAAPGEIIYPVRP